MDWYHRENQNWFDSALICLNGHLINDTSVKYPHHNSKYCDECGEATINCCQKCQAIIRGEYHMPDSLFISNGEFDIPSYCHECGEAYPWTIEILNAAKELADILDEISEEDREELKKSLDDIVRDTPRTVVASTKFKRVLSKTGPEIATGFKNILIDVVSETVKKTIWG